MDWQSRRQFLPAVCLQAVLRRRFVCHVPVTALARHCFSSIELGLLSWCPDDTDDSCFNFKTLEQRVVSPCFFFGTSPVLFVAHACPLFVRSKSRWIPANLIRRGDFISSHCFRIKSCRKTSSRAMRVEERKRKRERFVQLNSLGVCAKR